MNRKTLKGLIALVIILVANIGIFLLGDDFSVSFWISYVFAMIAALITVYVEIFLVEREKLIFGYPISAVTIFYLVVEVAVAFLMVHFLSYFALFVFIVQLVIFALYLVGLLSVMLHNTTVKEQQEVRGRDIVNFRYIVDSMNAVISKMEYTDPNRKVVQHACDAVASGQVRSNESVMDLEQQIAQQISILNQAVANKQPEQILACCKKIEAAAEERKRRLSQRARF